MTAKLVSGEEAPRVPRPSVGVPRASLGMVCYDRVANNNK
jgi:hypothetical protein